MRGSSPRMTKKFTVGRREEKMKTTQAAVVALVLALGAPAHGQAVEKKELTLAVGGKTALYYLPLTICERLGYFKEQGLDVTINDFRGSRCRRWWAAPSTSSPAPTSTLSACRPRGRTSRR